MMMLGNIRIDTRKEDKNNNRGNRMRMGDRVGNDKQSQTSALPLDLYYNSEKDAILYTNKRAPCF